MGTKLGDTIRRGHAFNSAILARGVMLPRGWQFVLGCVPVCRRNGLMTAI